MWANANTFSDGILPSLPESEPTTLELIERARKAAEKCLEMLKALPAEEMAILNAKYVAYKHAQERNKA